MRKLGCDEGAAAHADAPIETHCQDQSAWADILRARSNAATTDAFEKPATGRRRDAFAKAARASDNHQPRIRDACKHKSDTPDSRSRRSRTRVRRAQFTFAPLGNSSAARPTHVRIAHVRDCGATNSRSHRSRSRLRRDQLTFASLADASATRRTPLHDACGRECDATDSPSRRLRTRVRRNGLPFTTPAAVNGWAQRRML